MAKKKNKSSRGGGGGAASVEPSTGGESSLRTLVSELKKESNDNGELIVSSNFILSNISNNIADLTEHMLKMPVIMASSSNAPMVEPKPVEAIKEAATSGLEMKAEVVKETEKDNKREDKIKSTLEKSLEELGALRKDLKKGGLMDLLLGAGALIAGGIIGLVSQYFAVFKKIFKPLVDLFSGEGKMFANLLDKVKDGWKSFTGLFAKIANFISKGPIGEIGRVIEEAFAGIKQVFGSKEGGMIGKIISFFKEAGGKFKYFLKLGEVIGKKILFPIITIYDTVMGALEGYDKGGIFGAIKGAISGFINSIFGGVLDLLKDGVSWLLGLLGFENASKFLDSFSFQDLIKQAVDGFFNFIKSMFDFVMDVFTNPGKAMEKLAGIGDAATEGLKKILRSSLPTPGGSGISGIAAKFIPDAVYEFAGLDPKTGAQVTGTSETGVASKALTAVTGQNTAAKDEGASKAAAVAGAASAMSSNNSSQTVNNNSTQAAIIRSKTTNWEADDQWARGGGMAWGA